MPENRYVGLFISDSNTNSSSHDSVYGAVIVAVREFTRFI